MSWHGPRTAGEWWSNRYIVSQLLSDHQRIGAGVMDVSFSQVSHHPPITAMHAESNRGWVYRQHYSCDVKFRGNLRVR